MWGTSLDLGILWWCQPSEPCWHDFTCSWDFRLLCCSCIALGRDLGAIFEILKNCLGPAVGHLWPSEFQLSLFAVNKYYFQRSPRIKVENMAEMAPAIWKTWASPPWATEESRHEDLCHHGSNRAGLTPNWIIQSNLQRCFLIGCIF